MARNHPLTGSFVKIDDVVGRARALSARRRAAHSRRQLAAAGAGIGLTGRIPSGMRAIALRSDEVVGVAGFLMPGTHVDVLVTYTDNTHPEPVTATVLQDSEVLAAGHQVQPDPPASPFPWMSSPSCSLRGGRKGRSRQRERNYPLRPA